MGVMRLFRLIRAAEAIGTPPEVQPPSRATGLRSVSDDAALTLGSVYRAVDILTTAAVQLGLDVWRGTDVIEPPSIIRKPDAAVHRGTFVSTTVTDLASTGNAFWLKTADGPGAPVLNLEVLPAAEVSVHRDERTRTISYSWKSRPLAAWEVAHLKKIPRSGRLYGIGPIEQAAAELRGALDLRDYASTWFTDSGIPNGVLSTDQALSENQAKQWKQAAKDLWKPTEPAILGNGLKYAPLALRPADAQFLESRAFSVAEIARWFGIPAAYMLATVEGSSDTYSNQEQVDIWFVRYTLMSYLREIELHLSDVLPRGQSVRFNIESLLRTDTKTRYEGHEIAIRAGLYTAQHAQAIEGLPITAPTTAPAPAKDPTDAP